MATKKKKSNKIMSAITSVIGPDGLEIAKMLYKEYVSTPQQSLQQLPLHQPCNLNSKQSKIASIIGSDNLAAAKVLYEQYKKEPTTF